MGTASSPIHPIGNAALIENLDGARVQTAGAQAGEVLAGAPLDDGNVDARQCQLSRQHQPCRTSSDNRHRVLDHRSPKSMSSHRKSRPSRPGRGEVGTVQTVLLAGMTATVEIEDRTRATAR